MCRVTRTGVERCLYSDVLRTGCSWNEALRKEKVRGATWSLPIRPSLVRQEAFYKKAGSDQSCSESKGNPGSDLGEEAGHDGGPEPEAV